jgi:hypothetical protein
MKRQTAVGFLIEEIECRGLFTKELRIAFEQAKEMEKQDIMDAWKLGNLSTYLGKSTTAEKYYNNNFKH